MSKGSGGTRTKYAHPGSVGAKVKDGAMIPVRKRNKDLSYYYTENGVRKQFWELSEEKRAFVEKQLLPDLVASAMESYDNKPFYMEDENHNKTIETHLVRKPLYHAIRNMLRQQGGSLLSERDYANLPKILSKAVFLDKEGSRKDNAREYYYNFKDGTGRELYFKIGHEPTQGQKKYNYLYHIDVRQYNKG